MELTPVRDKSSAFHFRPDSHYANHFVDFEEFHGHSKRAGFLDYGLREYSVTGVPPVSTRTRQDLGWLISAPLD
jgi:hypothetical protein